MIIEVIQIEIDPTQLVFNTDGCSLAYVTNLQAIQFDYHQFLVKFVSKLSDLMSCCAQTHSNHRGAMANSFNDRSIIFVYLGKTDAGTLADIQRFSGIIENLYPI